MTLTVDLYWSFRSPYSYLATPRLKEIERDYDVTFNVKIVAPLAVRDPDFFERSDPRWLNYTIIDFVRVAQMNNIPLGPLSPDPIIQDITTRKIAPDQPYIFRLLRLGALAAERGKGLPLICEVSRAIWGGEKWMEGDVLKNAVARAGLDLEEMDKVIEAETDRLDEIVEKNEADQQDAGHWGVPLMVFNGEPFFGQDRIDVLMWRMNQHGLVKRK